MTFNHLYLTIFLALLLTACSRKPDRTRTCVLDNASALSEKERNSLVAKIIDLETSTGSQMAILIIPTLEGELIEDYSRRIATDWQLGRAELDDGLLITVSLFEKQIRIEVGDGLKKIITDEVAAKIISEDIVPHFRGEKYYHGLSLAVDDMAALIKDNANLIGARD